MSKMYVIIKENSGDYQVCAVTPDETKAKKLIKYFCLSGYDHLWYEAFYPEWEYVGLDDLTQIWRIQWSNKRQDYEYKRDGWHHGPKTFENEFYHRDTFSQGKGGFIGRIATDSLKEAIEIYEDEWERREKVQEELKKNHVKHRFIYDEIMPGVQIQTGIEEIKED